MRREKRLVVKLNAREHGTIVKLAESEHLPPSTLARRLLLLAAERRLWPEGQAQGDPGQVKMGEVARERVGL